MGGERETFLEKDQGAVGEETSITQEKGRSIRLHQSGGFVHFHDDAAKRKLKCAVPVAVWFKAWERLRGALPGESQKFNFVDVEEETVLSVLASCVLDSATDPPKYQYRMELKIAVDPCIADKNYTEVAKFTQGSR